MENRHQTTFEWDPVKNQTNQEKHGISFSTAQYAFADPERVVLEDLSHSTKREKRYFCLGEVAGGVLTVRFTYREHRIRIFGAGTWFIFGKIIFTICEGLFIAWPRSKLKLRATKRRPSGAGLAPKGRRFVAGRFIAWRERAKLP